ncbi:MAG TPA: dienelactone hydrolase family protein [Gemmatimonadaceae bacterium]|nr:dienelactone hydrolase family protein [Gemmatimonadaceae bacterium]
MPLTTTEFPVLVPAGNVEITGDLTVPTHRHIHGLVIFAHGSGSGRFSPRNKFVAEVLNEGGFATLLLDLLTQEEELIDQRTGQIRFDIALLARRVEYAIDWAHNDPRMRGVPIGLFGASTGAAAALIAAAHRHEVRAVVSRGGRPDLGGETLGVVRVPTLLIVGGDDEVVIDLNRQAMARMNTAVHLEIIPGASHLFEEGDTLAQAAQQARAWFDEYLRN